MSRSIFPLLLSPSLSHTRTYTIGVTHGDGGPFGAVAVQNGVIIATGHNRVLVSNDPTAHAEVVAIRNACAKLGRFSLQYCVLYASCHPCPMCLSAIICAKIPCCIYSSTPDDAAAACFDDRLLYEFIQGHKNVASKCVMKHVPHPSSNKPFALYAKALEDFKFSLY